MDKLGPLTASDIARSAIERSTNFSRELYKLQPEEITLPQLVGEDGSQVLGAEIKRLRLTTSSALFSIALDHHVALIVLLQNNMRSSAYALLRAIFDAVWRGAWAAFVAPDQNLVAFMAGRYDPKPEAAIKRLEEIHQLPKVLSSFYSEGWSAMSAFTHGGALQVQHWIGDGVIEPQHTDAGILEILDAADRLAFVACVLFLQVAELERGELADLADKFLSRTQVGVQHLPQSNASI